VRKYRHAPGKEGNSSAVDRLTPNGGWYRSRGSLGGQCALWAFVDLFYINLLFPFKRIMGIQGVCRMWDYGTFAIHSGAAVCEP
jgi:hypothetical protein